MSHRRDENKANMVGDLIGLVAKLRPLQRNFLDRAVASLTQEERRELENYLAFCVSTGMDVPFVAEAYNTIIDNMMSEQIFFKRNGRYRYSRYDEVASSVYLNPEYMSRYMVGLAVTTYFWPNHTSIHRFFRTALATAPTGRYLEIGPGHGVFFMEAVKSGKFENCLGVDLSPTSIAMTDKLLASGYFGSFSGYDLRCIDFLQAELPVGGFNAVVMGEVLEHVERPDAFMTRIGQLAAPGAFVFITTVINSPAIDHIYLFETPDSVRALVRDAGFVIRDELFSPYVGLSLEQTMAQRAPVNVALQLEIEK